jgi:hypothetical protein
MAAAKTSALRAAIGVMNWADHRMGTVLLGVAPLEL